MIIKLNTIGVTHAHRAIDYALHKEKSDKEKPIFLRANLIPQDFLGGVPETQHIYDCCLLRIKNSIHKVKDPFWRAEICPPMDECQNWNEEQWQKFLDNAVAQLDKNGTDLKHSPWVATQHRDTDNWHIHLVGSRITENGEIQEGHRCGLRAKKAAEELADKYGWVKAKDRKRKPGRKDDWRKKQMNIDAYRILREMTLFNIDVFLARMQAKGWIVYATRDRDGIVRGYTVSERWRRPNGEQRTTTFKASELGHSRDLTPSTIEATWNRMHGIEVMTLTEGYMPLQVTGVEYSYEGRRFIIPLWADDIIKNDVELPEPEEYEDEQEDAYPDGYDKEVENARATAAAIFIGLLTYESIPAGGGGNSPSGGWRDDDEEERERARRAARAATTLHTPAHSPKKIKYKR